MNFVGCGRWHGVSLRGRRHGVVMRHALGAATPIVTWLDMTSERSCFGMASSGTVNAGEICKYGYDDATCGGYSE